MSFELRLAKAKKLAELMETGQQMDDNRHPAPPPKKGEPGWILWTGDDSDEVDT